MSRPKNLFPNFGTPWSDAIESSDSDSKLPSYFPPTDSLAAQHGNPRNVHDPSRSPKPLSFRASVSQSGFDAFNDQPALKLRDSTQDGETIFPIGVGVSTPSVSDTNSIPSA